MNYVEAIRKIVAEYKKRLSEYEQAELDFMASDPEFSQNEKQLRKLNLDKALGKKVSAAQIKEATLKNKEIRKRLGLILPAPCCSRCNDTGRVNGKICDCAVSLAIKSQSNEISIPLHSFKDVDYSVYGDKCDEYKKTFANINEICSLYPANKKRCIIIGGNTGNGKTYLAGCAAQKVLERGLSVMALTAFAANNRFLKYHTTFDENKSNWLDPMLDCALLIIDDLGTESMLKNVTAEYFYQVINERNSSGKLTLITTNLYPDNINDRYGERTYSRLFDKSLSFTVYLTANDIRKVL